MKTTLAVLLSRLFLVTMLTTLMVSSTGCRWGHGGYRGGHHGHYGGGHYGGRY